LIGDLRVRDIFVDLGLDSSIILKSIFKKESEMFWTGSLGIRIGKVKGYCNVSLESMKTRKFLTKWRPISFSQRNLLHS